MMDLWSHSDLEVSQLGKLLPAILKLTEEGLDLFMHNLVGANVPSLSKPFTTMIARVRTFPGVATLMSLLGVNINLGLQICIQYLEIAELREPLAA